MTRLLRHVRRQAVGYLALFVALGGTSYAAYSLPANSVGNRQIRNHSIDPDKMNLRLIGGTVRLWASIGAHGKVLAGGHGEKVYPPYPEEPGVYAIQPPSKTPISDPKRCAAIASVDNQAGKPGYADAVVGYFGRRADPRWQLIVDTYNALGQPTSLPFDVVVLC